MEPIDQFVVPLLLAYVLDLLLADPAWLPHPVRGFGAIINIGEKYLNNSKNKVLKGSIFAFSLILSIFFFFYVVILFIQPYPIIYTSVSTILLFFTLANKGLVQEGKAVFFELGQSLEAGRRQLSRIVGRETSSLNENQVRMAVFETMSENLSDGVIAPLFYYAILGVPGALAYKMINTLDSMIGYKNERFKQFGMFAARLDDVVNFVPARMTAVLMALVSLKFNVFKFILKYGHQHSSPNAGYPESALAGILDCRFGGPNYYHGKLVEKPFIGENAREVSNAEINKVVFINHMVTAVFILIIIVTKWIVINQINI